MTIEQFGQQIKSKYPQYKDIPDNELGQKMLTKYPQYQNIITTAEPKKIDTFLSGHSILKGINDLIGTTGLAKGATQAIFLNFTKEGKDIQRMLDEGKITPEEYDSIIGGGLATPKEVIGSAVKTATTIGGLGTPAKTAVGRIATGTAIGAGYGLGEGIEKKETIGGVVKEVGKGALIGTITSGVLDGMGALLKKISGSKIIQTKSGNVYNKELQPKTKDLANEISKGFKTFGQDVASVVDDNGKPVYIGTYDTLLNKAKNEISTKGSQLEQIIKDVPNVKITKNQIANDIIEKMENYYGQLTPTQLKQIQFEVNRMPKSMDLSGVLKSKRLYDSLIPDSFWSNIGDPATSFPSLVKYTLRDNARKIINSSTNNPLVQKLNKELSIAMDVRALSALQKAIRAKRKLTATGGLWGMLGKVLDDTLFNPAITTRSAQALKEMGSRTGQTLPRQIIREQIIKTTND